LAKPRDLTTGSIPGSVWYLAWPIVLASLLQVTMQIADTMMVGHLGDEKGTNAVAALAGSMIILLFIMTLGIAISTGTAVLLARRTGEKDIKAVARVTANAATMTVAVCILFLTPIGLILTGPITTFLKVKGQAALYMADYLNVTFTFLVVMFLVFVCNTAFRATGDSRTSLVIMFLINAINLFLNWVLIYGKLGLPAMEVKGAAVATVISRGVGIVVSFILLWRHPRVMLGSVSPVQFNFAQWWRIIRVGIPTTLQAITRNGSNLIIFRIINGTSLGVAAAAAYGIGVRVMMVPVFIGLSFMQVSMALVGQNLGAKKPDRAQSAGNWTAMFSIASGLIVAIIMVTIPETLTRAFLRNPSPEATRLTVRFFYIVAGSLPFLGYLLAISGSLRGAGATVAPLVFSIIARIGLLLPLAWVLACMTSLDATGVWIAISCSTFIQFALTWFWWRRGKWKQIKV